MIEDLTTINKYKKDGFVCENYLIKIHPEVDPSFFYGHFDIAYIHTFSDRTNTIPQMLSTIDMLTY